MTHRTKGPSSPHAAPKPAASSHVESPGSAKSANGRAPALVARGSPPPGRPRRRQTTPGPKTEQLDRLEPGRQPATSLRSLGHRQAPPQQPSSRHAARPQSARASGGAVPKLGLQARFQEGTIEWRSSGLVANAAAQRPGRIRDQFSPTLAAKFPVRFQFYRLKGTDALWLCSRTIFRGSYKRMSMGLQVGESADVPGNKVAISQTFSKKQSRGRMKATSLVEAATEAELTKFIREMIEQRAPELEGELWPEGPNPLVSVRSGWQKSLVLDHFTDEESRYFCITTLELGGSSALVDRLPNRERTDVVASFVIQVALETLAMHQQSGYAHLDLRLENITFNGFGQFKLMDFGHAQPIGAGDSTGVKDWPYGTIALPEMMQMARAPSDEVPALTARVDHFCLGASAWQLLAGSHVRNPFRWDYRPGTDEIDVEGTRRRFAAFGEFFARLGRDEEGRVTLPRRADGAWPRGAHHRFDLSALPPIDEPVVRAFLHSAIKRAPDIANVLLGLLDPEPTTRTELDAVARQMVPLLPGEGSRRQQGLRAYWAKQEADGVYHAVYRDAQTFGSMLEDAESDGGGSPSRRRQGA